MSAATREKQIAEAQALLGDGKGPLGFAAGLYFGLHHGDALPPYPSVVDDQTSRMVAELRTFCQSDIDPAAIDRDADIPRRVIEGLGRLGVLGACLPKSSGGRGMSQTQYC